MPAERRRPVVQVCQGCGEATRDCECGDSFRPAGSLFDDPNQLEDDDDDA